MAKQKQKINEMKDILILYEKSDSQAWTDFIHETFKECPHDISIEVLDLSSNIDEIRTLLECFSMVLVIISHEMLSTMESAANTLNVVLQNHSCVSVIKLFLEQKEFAELQQFYQQAQKWKEFSISEDDTEENITSMISQIIDDLEKLRVPKQPAPGLPGRRQSRIVTVCPENVREGGEAMIIVLRKEVGESQCVQVSIGEDKKLLDTKKLNPYCFSFKAPAHKAGRVDLRLFIDGKKISKYPIRYSSMTKFAYTCPVYLCQLIGLNPDDKSGLDMELTNIFKNSAPQDGSLQSLLSPKVLQSTATGGIEGCGELPTLLHFACKYSLNDLAVSIIETPGSHVAITMDNERGLSPRDLAEENNNEDLIHYLDSFVEMHDYVTGIEDLYEVMKRGVKPETYINTGESTVTSRPGYLSMKGHGVEEAYITARVPSDGYEITGTPAEFPGAPEEVKEEDDIPPVPVRKPTKRGPEVKVPAKPPLEVTGKRNIPQEVGEQKGERKFRGGTISPSEQRFNQRNIDLEDNEDIQKRKESGFEDFPPMPKDDFFGGPVMLSPFSMGSTNLDELSEYAEAYKRGEFSLDDIERLYKAWHERNRDLTSNSFKERKKQLDEFKSTHQSLLSLQKDKKKKTGLLWKKKEKQEKEIEIQIQHHVKPNTYESWGIMSGTQFSRQNRESTISNASTTSSSSSSSRDSALGTVQELSSESENSDAEPAPAVPVRRRSDSSRSRSDEKKENRQSWGDQFLTIVKNKPHSRLPKPPPTNPTYVKHRLPSTPEVPSTKPTYVKHRLPSTPEVPPRPKKSPKPRRDTR